MTWNTQQLNYVTAERAWAGMRPRSGAPAMIERTAAYHLAHGYFDFATDVFKMALVYGYYNTGDEGSVRRCFYHLAKGYELIGPSYTPGGVELQNIVVTQDGITGEVVISWDDVEFQGCHGGFTLGTYNFQQNLWDWVEKIEGVNKYRLTSVIGMIYDDTKINKPVLQNHVIHSSNTNKFLYENESITVRGIQVRI